MVVRGFEKGGIGENDISQSSIGNKEQASSEKPGSIYDTYFIFIRENDAG